jgi:RND family efflux transporter MFP subunit
MTKSKFLTAIVIGAIALVSVGIVFVINSTEPQAQREAATKKTAMLVDVQEVRRGNYNPRIEGLGTVEAAQDIILSPRVGGRVIEIADNFIPGGFVKKDEVLLRIDPADYENAVAQMESTVAQAQSEFDVELGRQDVAKKEYDLLKQDLGDKNKSLVLREPQLAAAKANLKSVQSMLNQAQLELERTYITAPFDAQILSRNANVGSEIDSNMEVARLVGIDEYWVIVSVPVARLERITFPENGEPGAKVIIRNRAAWSDGASREGEVVRLIGALDGQTRLARVLVSVEDPLALNPETQGPQMLVGAIVQAEIAGRTLENVFRIDRDFLREGDRLWLKRDGKLTITDAKVAFKDKDYAYISEGMEDGDLLVISNLAAVAEGISLRTEAETQ